jgi:3-methyladenine DNA glycosylase AlkD
MITGKLVPIAYLDRCLVSANFWKRRAALIAQIKSLRRGKGDVQRHLEFCQKLMTEREFFIRKAIGWSLRELAKSEPRLVFDFLLKSKAEISGLSLREASKNLPAELKQYLV